MAINSVLSPEKIIGKQNKNPALARNFISGGSPMGDSIINSAANKIVQFQRASVKPVSPDFNSIIGTITNNVLNSVDSSIKNATNILNQQVINNNQQLRTEVYNQIKQISSSAPVTQLQTIIQNIQSQTVNSLQKSINAISSDYKNKINKIDSAKPINILEKFLSTYKNALQFIQFFSNKKNLSRISDALIALKKSFTDSFEVSKLIRQVIQKIVNQLTSLPKATPGGGGGINLDIDLPGNTLKKSAPSEMKKMFGKKGKMFALGAGALGAGAGAGAGAAVNALSDSNMIQPALSGLGIPGDLFSTFGSILERFISAIDTLTGIGKGSESKGRSGGGSRSSSSAPGASPRSSPGPGPGPSSGTIPSVTGEGTPEQQALLKSLRFAEGTTSSYGTIFGGNVVKELEEGKLTVQEVINMADTGKLPQRLGGKAIPGYGSGSKATGAYQFMPFTLEDLINQGALKPNELFTPQVQDRAALALANIRLKGNSAEILKKEGLSARVANLLSPEWASFPTLSGRSYYGQPVKSLKDIQQIYNQSIQVSPKPLGQGGPDLPDWMLPAEKQNQYRNLATNVFQPPPSQQAPQINVLPLTVPGSGMPQASRPSGPSVSAPPAPAQNSVVSIPNIPSGNPDNFLVLYSKMVYNIVDG